MTLIVLIIYLLRLAYAKGNKEKQDEIKTLYKRHLASFLAHPILFDLITTYYVTSKEFGIITKDYSTIKTIALGICTYTTIWATTRPCDIAFKIHHLRTSRRQWGVHYYPMSVCNTRELSRMKWNDCWRAVSNAKNKSKEAEVEAFEFVLSENSKKGMTCGERSSNLSRLYDFSHITKEVGEVSLKECRDNNCGYACHNLDLNKNLMDYFRSWKVEGIDPKLKDEIIEESITVLTFFTINELKKNDYSKIKDEINYFNRFEGGNLWYHPYFRARRGLVKDLVRAFLLEFFPKQFTSIDLEILTPEGKEKYNESYERFKTKMNWGRN